MYTKPMMLDKKLGQDLDVVFQETVSVQELFGFEMELEGKNLKTLQNDIIEYWTMVNDGSLRVKMPGDQAVEYVFRRPQTLDNTHDAIKRLIAYLTQPHVTVYPSYRTSIHVHVNCAADMMRHVYNFMALAVIFDELFVSQNGEHRIGNNFCLRAKDAQGQIMSVVKSIEQNGNIYSLSPNNRYSSVNFSSLLKYGTLEFRSLECTTDLERIQHWLDTLYKLKTACRQFDDPQDIIRYFSRMSPKEFLYFVLGAQASKYAKVDGFEEMLMSGMRLAQDFAYSSSWTNYTEKKVQPKKIYQPDKLPPNLVEWVVAQQEQGAHPQEPMPVMDPFALPVWGQEL